MPHEFDLHANTHAKALIYEYAHFAGLSRRMGHHAARTFNAVFAVLHVLVGGNYFDLSGNHAYVLLTHVNVLCRNAGMQGWRDTVK
jgi:hypothetical protein